ncbi:MAG: hypothetical protein ACI4WG_05270 [Erysipelotrichaceae bacterium]
MKCPYIEKICPELNAKPCTTCMTEEINYLRKKVVDMAQRNNAKAGSIMITKDELITAQAEALARLSLANPALFIIADELSKASALTAAILFDKKEEKNENI